eukprot:1183416-Prorocentrum_minimum.AAC.2
MFPRSHANVFTLVWWQVLSVENLHYWAQFIWVISNLLWALGELFEPFAEHSVAEDMSQVGHLPSNRLQAE